jgi:3-hydroxybutyryl-CoA dehydrogenase
MGIKDIKVIGIVGAGTMGSGIALSYALGGYQVILYTRSEKSLDSGLKNIREALGIFQTEALLSQKQCTGILNNIKPTNTFDDLERADFICENVPDNIEIKKEVFQRIDQLCPSHTILASNTSTLTLSSFTKQVKRQDKLLITHYFNPAFLIPAVEVVKGASTSEETYAAVYNILIKAKKMPVRINKEIPGHLVNRVQFAMWRELYHLYCLGAASIEDIDRVCQGSFGIRLATMGPLLTDDMAGSPKWGQIGIDMCNTAFQNISDEKKVPQEVQDLLLSGKGFYNLNDEQMKNFEEMRNKALLQQLRLTYPELLP